MKTPLFLVAVLALASCDKPTPSNVVRREGKPDYIRVEDKEQATMEQAIERARKEIDTFIAALANPKPSQSHLSVKKPFSWKNGDETNYEHIWLSYVTFKNGIFHGRVGNEPVDVKDVKLGDEVTLQKAEASDWMYIENDYLVGGYTIRILYEAMPPDERADFDSNVPFKIRQN
jgi:uncharacterized protein YegJ (DUF2314 family)